MSESYLEKDEKGYYVMASDGTRININFVKPFSKEEAEQKMRELPEAKKYDGIHALFWLFSKSIAVPRDFKDLSAKELDLSEKFPQGYGGIEITFKVSDHMLGKLPTEVRQALRKLCE